MRNQIIALCSVLCLSACDLEVEDLNNPGLETLTQNPTRTAIASAATGLLVTLRNNMAEPNGYVAELGVLGRESYILDPADPRFVTELILNPQLDPGSPAFGGNHWTIPYRGIRNATLVLNAVNIADPLQLTDAEKEATRGFAMTIQALEYMIIYNTRYDLGGVIVNTVDPTVLEPIVGRPEIEAYIQKLLDDAVPHLMSGGAAFPFPLSSGFEGFDTPATFIPFNRAVKARMSVYVGENARALTELAQSFISVDDLSPQLGLGVYHAYRSATGDLTNNLIVPQVYAHPSIRATAQSNAADQLDLRVADKLAPLMDSVTVQDLTANDRFKIYKLTTPVPIIRNEELILLRAEAKIFTNDLAGATADLNFVRTHSGGLDPYPVFTDAATATNALVYERQNSLMLEGGHRWIDLRRLGRLDTLPTDGGTIHRQMPIPVAETDPR